MLSIYKHACSTVKNSFKKQVLWKKVYIYEKHLLEGDIELTSNFLMYARCKKKVKSLKYSSKQIYF